MQGRRNWIASLQILMNQFTQSQSGGGADYSFPPQITNIFDFTTMVPQIDLFSFVFWENWRHQKYISKLTDL